VIDFGVAFANPVAALASRRERWAALVAAPCGYWPDGVHCYANVRIYGPGRLGHVSIGNDFHTVNAKGCKCGAIVEGPTT
jgi:hypothetical protein